MVWNLPIPAATFTMSAMMRAILMYSSLVVLLFALSAAQTAPKQAKSSSTAAPQAALQSISADRMLQNIKTLSSDEFEGRGPGSRGEERTVQFLEKQFKDIGLEPGNPDGTYIQKVPMVGITPDPNMKLDFDGKVPQPQFQKDYVAWTKRVVETASIDAPMVFVGYAAQAPEYQWDDFKGVDVKGKVLVVLINDPPDPDPKVFGGKAMTYYGRWTYKFEKAAEKGAAGCLIIHQTDRAGYPWEVVRNSWGSEQFDLSTLDKNMKRVAIEGWITHDLATAVFKAAGKDLAALEKLAATRGFKPVDLGIRAKLTVHNKLRNIDSRNVIGKITGSDPQEKEQYVIYTAHWDHFGIGPEVNGDKIYHGAADNASGVAALLEMARAYKQLPKPAKRTLLFLSVTGEEQGLLGSRYYAEHPLYPVAKTMLNVNMDGMNTLGKTKDIVMIGRGQSNIDELVDSLVKAQGRVVKPDPEPEKGFYYRSDHFSFAKVGVPAFDPNDGIDFIGKPAGWGMKMRDQYTANDYHKPSDKVKDYWNLSGAVEDAQLYFEVGYKVSNGQFTPQWKQGSEFKTIREKSQGK
jgi:Zn-dependent M28 family amino/carboxypeptidase